MKTVVFDLDGTLANIEHRLHFIDKDKNIKPDWDTFNKACVADGVIEGSSVILKALYSDSLLQDLEVVILTGRSEEVRDQTVEWLCEHQIPFHELYMRTEGDFRPAKTFKQGWINKQEPGSILFAVENINEDVWVKNDIPVYRLI